MSISITYGSALRLVTPAVLLAACSMFSPPSEENGLGLGDAGTAGTNGADGGGVGGSSGDGAAGSGSSTGAQWWLRANKDGCTTASVPGASDRPSTSDPGRDLEPVYLAMSRVRFGAVKDDVSFTPDLNAFQNIGVDLDGVCTSSLGCEVNQVTIDERACKSPSATPADGAQCRDNEVGRLFNTLAGPGVGRHFRLNEADWNCELHRGGFGVILKISAYNGLPNDRNVRVDLYASSGLRTQPSWQCRDTLDGPLDADFYRNASWAPNDPWQVVEQSLDLSAPTEGSHVRGARAADPAAFVRDGYLVAHFPEGTELWFNGDRASIPGFRFNMHRSTLIARLKKERDDLWVIDEGTVGFVSRPDELLLSLRQIGLCENACTVFDVLSQYFYTHQDTLEGTSEILPDTQCNAVSVGVDFEARQASASSADVTKAQPLVVCPIPKNPAAPRPGCTCQPSGECT